VTHLQSGFIGFAIGLLPLIVLFAVAARRSSWPQCFDSALRRYEKSLRASEGKLADAQYESISRVCGEELSLLLDARGSLAFVPADKVGARRLEGLGERIDQNHPPGGGAVKSGPDLRLVT
jgi:hypothetical protein